MDQFETKPTADQYKFKPNIIFVVNELESLVNEHFGYLSVHAQVDTNHLCDYVPEVCDNYEEEVPFTENQLIDISSINDFLDEINPTENDLECLNKFSVDEIYHHILNLRELSKDEREMYIMGSLQNEMSQTSITNQGKRQRQSYGYKYQGKTICKSAFQITYDIGEKSLKNIFKHMNKNGVVPRIHGNVGKKPKHAFDFEDVQRALWLKYCPHIKIAEPRDDVCMKCEKARKKIMDARTENEKLEAITEFQQHITSAQNERDVYKACIMRAKEEILAIGVRQSGIVPPLSTDFKHVHYTFDFSQSVNLPHHSRQMGLIYFITPRKTHIFGFRIDGTSEQLNFLIDESQTMGEDGKDCHDANAVISMVDYALSTKGFGEQECGIHVDNCGGQNKNMYVLAYFAWRVICGLHKSIAYMMQIPGHTRCLVDAGFAHGKRLFRRSECETIFQLRDIFEKSAVNNKAVLYEENGNQTWEWRNWKAFLSARFKALKGIQKFHHFRIEATSPGKVFVKENHDSIETSVSILKVGAVIDGSKPDPIPAAGLSQERAKYLYRVVRPFVRPQYQDSLCPRPNNISEE
ncbi:hypothetical protein KUTeg_007888 [Tegillarca granosa]|uniref:DUF7869 domain-containing protein n=1 Tax=Tegillarca granosa TaxID=220873 RepID=A0ABQ9FEG9_TEGGR|nr:hypothetical protein KUTeg_007888 [Tegillarca granosa]